MKQQLLGNTINLLGIRNKVILVHSNGDRYSNDKHIYMRAISFQEEAKLDKRSDKSLIYFYGDIDISKQEDVKIIRDYNLFQSDGKGLIYNNFDYTTGTFQLHSQYNGKETEQVVKWGPCIDPVAWFKYNHCLIGKPKRVVVYLDPYGQFKI